MNLFDCFHRSAGPRAATEPPLLVDVATGLTHLGLTAHWRRHITALFSSFKSRNKHYTPPIDSSHPSSNFSHSCSPKKDVEMPKRMVLINIYFSLFLKSNFGFSVTPPVNHHVTLFGTSSQP